MVHILFWNPDISSVTRERMAAELPEIILSGYDYNWSFREYENVKPGDICYLVRCSDEHGPHGVVLRAKIISFPYISEDWSGQNRTVYYADWIPQEFIDTELESPLSPEVLEKLMPDFNWRGGASGRELPEEYAPVLEKAWYDHLRKLLPSIDEGLLVNAQADGLTAATLDFWKEINAYMD